MARSVILMRFRGPQALNGQICLKFLELYEKIYAPLTAGILQPFANQSIPKEKITALDRR